MAIAFPTAEGFGKDSIGGRGGTVIRVTNTNNSGAGSLRAALTTSGARIIVFTVGGTITLLSDITITEPYVTIAGQTAPGDGILIRDYSILIQDGCHDVIMRHIRTRVGTTSGLTNNGIVVYGNTASLVYNVILDHCSISWARDQNCDAFGNVDLVTFQWCIIAEGSTADSHSAGTIVGREGGTHVHSRVSIHHCLYAHNSIRNPLLSFYMPNGTHTGTWATVDIRNCVIYNWSGSNFAEFQVWFFGESEYALWDGSDGLKVNLVNCHFIRGGDSSVDNDSICAVYTNFVSLYIEGNMCPAFPSSPPSAGNGWDSGVDYYRYSNDDYSTLIDSELPASPTGRQSTTEHSVTSVTTHATTSVKAVVLAEAGCTVPTRDAVDTRIVADVNALTGSVGVGSGYPTINSGTAPTDSDSDGMPDTWEDSHGLNKNSALDADDVRASGYTNIENYINELAGDDIPNDYGEESSMTVTVFCGMGSGG